MIVIRTMVMAPRTPPPHPLPTTTTSLVSRPRPFLSDPRAAPQGQPASQPSCVWSTLALIIPLTHMMTSTNHLGSLQERINPYFLPAIFILSIFSVFLLVFPLFFRLSFSSFSHFHFSLSFFFLLVSY